MKQFLSVWNEQTFLSLEKECLSYLILQREQRRRPPATYWRGKNGACLSALLSVRLGTLKTRPPEKDLPKELNFSTPLPRGTQNICADDP